MKNVIWYTAPGVTAPPKGYWCYGMLEEIFADFEQWEGFHAIPPAGEHAVVVIPAEYHVDHVDQINHDMQELSSVTLILASDERGIFPVESLWPVSQLWVMTPHFEKHIYPEGTRFLGCYYPQDAREHLAAIGWKNERAWGGSFSGQVTHQRRTELRDAVEDLPFVKFNGTAGFTQGLGRREYYELLADSKTVPAPAGPVTLDSFRAYEALEAGCVPILDLKCPVDQPGERYWNAVLGEGHPLPTVDHWNKAFRPIMDVSAAWPVLNNIVFSWWQLYKRRLRYELTGADPGKITVLVPTSPIPSHPSMKILLETLASVRYNLPDADIIIMCDGVRDEQRHLADQYNEYVRELLWLCNFDELWEGIYPLVSVDHQHQANMTRQALDYVRTSTILFVEHDTPLVLDRPFDWSGLQRVLDEGHVDMIRFHYAGHIHPEHEHMMVRPVREVAGVPLLETVQWSQRPHLAGTEYYRWILKQYFPESGRTMIEDAMHSWAQVYPQFNRIAIYHPDDGDGSIVRSYHTDGRKEEPKFDMVYR